MFIDRRDNKIHQSPRGATCAICLNQDDQDLRIRRIKDGKTTLLAPVALNPDLSGRGDMCINRDAGGGSLLHRFKLFAELVNLGLHLLLTPFFERNDDLRNGNRSRYQAYQPYHHVPHAIQAFPHSINFVIQVFLHGINSGIYRFNFEIDIFFYALFGRGVLFFEDGAYVFFGQFAKCGGCQKE